MKISLGSGGHDIITVLWEEALHVRLTSQLWSLRSKYSGRGAPTKVLTSGAKCMKMCTIWERIVMLTGFSMQITLAFSNDSLNA